MANSIGLQLKTPPSGKETAAILQEKHFSGMLKRFLANRHYQLFIVDYVNGYLALKAKRP